MSELQIKGMSKEIPKTYLQLANELKNKILTDTDYLSETTDAKLGTYFELKSDKGSKKEYETCFKAVGFIEQPYFLMKNIHWSLKFKNYDVRAYMKNEVFFIYAKKKDNVEKEMKTSLSELSKIINSEMAQIKKKFDVLKKEESEKKEPLEIIILKFPETQLKNYKVN
ncbi:MAG: hypothetical protein PHN19_06010 [Patescibacteria group bacterium]|nr:hypothetical protein [Patescibacteria group bacterium]